MRPSEKSACSPASGRARGGIVTVRASSTTGRSPERRHRRRTVGPTSPWPSSSWPAGDQAAGTGGTAAPPHRARRYGGWHHHVMTYGHAVHKELREPSRALRRAIPEVYDGYRQMHAAAYAAGALDEKTKEL